MSRRVGQQGDELQQLNEGTRPAVCEHQRERTRATPTLMHEVDGQALNVGGELGKGVQATLLRAPIEGGCPVANQISQVVEIHAAGPAWVWQRVRPPGVSEPRSQVVEDLVRDVNSEWFRMHHNENLSLNSSSGFFHYDTLLFRLLSIALQSCSTAPRSLPAKYL